MNKEKKRLLSGAKTALAFGAGIWILWIAGYAHIHSETMIMISPGLLIGLLIAAFNQDVLDKEYFVITPVIISGSLLVSVVAYSSIGIYLPEPYKMYGFHFYWLSGFIASVVMSMLFCASHPIQHVKKVVRQMILVCTSLSILYGFAAEHLKPFDRVLLATALWLMTFGFIGGYHLKKETSTSPTQI